MYQNTVPSPKNRVAAARIEIRNPEAAQHPPGQPHVEAADQRGDELGIGVEPPQGHERQQEHRGQRWERDQGPARRLSVRVRERQHVQEEVIERLVVLGRPGAVGRVRVGAADGILDADLAVEPRGRLPREMVVEVVALRVAHEVGEQDQAGEGEADRSLPPPTRRGRDPQGSLSVHRLPLRYTPLHFSARPGGPR